MHIKSNLVIYKFWQLYYRITYIWREQKP